MLVCPGYPFEPRKIPGYSNRGTAGNEAIQVLSGNQKVVATPKDISSSKKKLLNLMTKIKLLWLNEATKLQTHGQGKE